MCVADMNRVVHDRLLPWPVLFMATIGTITTGDLRCGGFATVNASCRC